MTHWSAQIAAKYRLQLPPDLADWFDSGTWKAEGGAEYHLAIEPERLLDPEPGTIWGGFMLPDTLPLVGNQYGDWLCLRCDWAGEVAEIVAWNHGGGDWKPFGDSLAAALLLDAALLTTFGRRHEFGETHHRTEKPFTKAEWAIQHIVEADRLGRFWQEPAVSEPEVLWRLRDLGVAEVGARRELALRALQGPLRARCNETLANLLEIPWEPDMVRTMFDERLCDPSQLSKIAERLGLAEHELYGQNWDVASLEADAVTLRRQDLGWAFDITGWDFERREQVDKAIPRYLNGVKASLFTDDSVGLRTHWFPLGFGKFSAWRLFELRDHLDTERRNDDYLQQFWADDANTLRARISSYWMSRALRAQQDDRHQDAYQAFYRSGWDCGLLDVRDYEPILQGMVESAEAGGASGLAEVGRLHLKFL